MVETKLESESLSLPEATKVRAEAIEALAKAGLNLGEHYKEVTVNQPSALTSVGAVVDLTVCEIKVTDPEAAFFDPDYPIVKLVRETLEAVHSESTGWGNVMVKSCGGDTIDYKRCRVNSGAVQRFIDGL